MATTGFCLTESGKRLAEKNVGLALHAAAWFKKRGVPPDDAESDGMLALTKAVAAWSEETGYAFSTFVRGQARSVLSDRARYLARHPEHRTLPLEEMRLRGGRCRGLAAVDRADELAAALSRLTPAERRAAEASLSGRALTKRERDSRARERARKGRPPAAPAWTSARLSRLREAVAAGMSAAEGAAYCGVTPHAFQAKKIRAGLVARPKPRWTEEATAALRAAVAEGLDDAAGARRVGTTPEAFRHRRTRLGLERGVPCV